MWSPIYYDQIDVATSSFTPNTLKSVDNAAFAFWQRSLFQRASSVLEFELPEEWQGSTKDFFLYCLFKFGFVAVSENAEFGKFFQPCGLGGAFNFYYQPTIAVISNPLYRANLKIGEECELIKLTPDYMGVFDIVNRYAIQLAQLDNALNMSIVNNKFAYMVAAKNRGAAQTLKKVFDKINQGEPAVFFDKEILNDSATKSEPWQFLERKNMKDSYLTTMQLQDMQTILNSFDSEVGIPTIPYQKAERMVTSEAESRVVDSTARSTVWLETLQSSLIAVNKRYGLNITVKLRYELPEKEGSEYNGE